MAVEIDVGPGAVLELSDIAGTVAYHGRGLAASWQTQIRLGEGAHLTYAGLPLVVSDGADVTRTLTVDLAEGATARLRETLVLGRTGEAGGRLDASTLLHRSGGVRSGGELARERMLLEPGVRDRPGVLAGVRVVDSVLRLGQLPREVATTPDPSSEGCATYFSADPTPSRSGSTGVTTRTDVVTYELVDGESTLTRFLGTSLADSPLH